MATIKKSNKDDVQVAETMVRSDEPKAAPKHAKPAKAPEPELKVKIHPKPEIVAHPSGHPARK